MDQNNILIRVIFIFILGFATLLSAAIVSLATDDDAWAKWLRVSGFVTILIGFFVLVLVLVLGGVTKVVKNKKEHDHKEKHSSPST